MDAVPDEVALLISDLRHEVNNSLMAILGYVELLLGRNDLPGDAVAKLRHVNVEANKIRKQLERTAVIVRPAGR